MKQDANRFHGVLHDRPMTAELQQLHDASTLGQLETFQRAVSQLAVGLELELVAALRWMTHKMTSRKVSPPGIR